VGTHNVDFRTVHSTAVWDWVSRARGGRGEVAQAILPQAMLGPGQLGQVQKFYPVQAQGWEVAPVGGQGGARGGAGGWEVTPVGSAGGWEGGAGRGGDRSLPRRTPPSHLLRW